MATESLIALSLDIQERWAVGAPVCAADLDIDLPVQRRPGGISSAHLPGTSVAGSLKSHLRRTLGVDAATWWLGDDPKAFEEHAQESPTPSRMAIAAVLVTDSAVSSRGQTAVDTWRGAAKGRSLRFSEHSAPASATIVLHHSGRPDSGLLAALASWHPYVGRGRATGMGSARVIEVRTAQADLSTSSGLHWWLTDRHSWPQVPAPPQIQGPRVDCPTGKPAEEGGTYGFVVTEPVHVGAGGTDEQEKSQVAPVEKLHGRAYIPGSSWKGIFRHRCEMIVRALGGNPDQSKAVGDWIFGNTSKPVTNQPEVGVTHRSRIRFEDSPFGDISMVAPHHVAIDRFTGGARDSALFQLEAVPRGAQIQLTWSWLGGDAPPEPVKQLLAHVIRDLHDGLIGIGGAGARGYGRIQLEEPPRVVPMNLERLIGIIDHDEEAIPAHD